MTAEESATFAATRELLGSRTTATIERPRESALCLARRGSRPLSGFPRSAVLLIELRRFVIAALRFQCVAQSGERAAVAWAAFEIDAKYFFGFFELALRQQDATERRAHGRKPGRRLDVIER